MDSKILVIMVGALLCGACSDDDPTGKAVNHPCDHNSDCVDDICHSGICASPTPKANGAGCKGNGECESFNCVGGRCVPGNRLGGEACINHQECGTNKCLDGTCTGAVADAGPDDAPPDRGTPDAPALDKAAPDKATPDVPAPDKATPDMPAPDKATPDTSVPDLPAPDMSLCGNGTVDPGEQCDKTAPAGVTCVSLGFTGGSASCRKDCKVSSLGCHKVEHGTGFKVSDKSDSSYATVASDGKDYLVTWSRSSYRYAARVSAAGKVLDTTPITLGQGAYGPTGAVGYGGGYYLVVWNVGKYFIARRVTPAGKPLDGLGIPINPQHGGSDPRVSFDGTNFLVVWSQVSAIYAARVSPSGKLLDAKAVKVNKSTPHARTQPAVAFDGTNYLVAFTGTTWLGPNKPDLNIYANRLSTSLKVLHKTDITVSKAINHQSHPAVAFGKTNFLVAWIDLRTGTRFNGGARVTKAGVVLDPNGLMVGYASEDAVPPRLGHDGQHFFVSWLRAAHKARRRSEGWRLDAQGNPVGSWFVLSSPKPYTDEKVPAMVFSGSQYLLVWSDVRSKYSGKHIYGNRIRFGK